MPHKRQLRSLTCQECGELFIGVDFGGGNVHKTCSQECFLKAKQRNLAKLPRRGAANNRWAGGVPSWICIKCGSQFSGYKVRNGLDRKYCSKICANWDHRLTVFDMRARLRFENKLAAFLENRGYQCIRSAGSRGVVDIFAINENHVRAIQLKTTKNALDTSGNLSTFKKAILGLRSLPSPPNMTRELWVKELRKNWIYIVIDDLPEDPGLLRKAISGAQWVAA